MAADRRDIVNMLRSEKHRSRKHRTFAMPTTGFDGDSVHSPIDEQSQHRSIDASRRLLKDFAW